MPEQSLAVIGDVHGCAELLETLLTRIEAQDHDAQLVFVGDMVDRGPGSQAVLARIRSLSRAVALRGNHEQMMLGFLDEPETIGASWLDYGGAQTLDSFGITRHVADTQTRDALRNAMPAGLEDWLRSLPCWWRSGNVAVVHAGADPRSQITHQNPRDLIWGHPAFGRFPRRDGLWVVHGHTVVPKPRQSDGVISVDTGAWQGGGLSAALISTQGVEFLTIGR
ncbi:MAG TPA: metallophosphoesterase family protein [Paenirhodobacter sp.]